jgi:hypothetical protein
MFLSLISIAASDSCGQDSINAVQFLDEQPVPQSTRYGLFNCLDSRSTYGTGALPEPFLVDDSDLEINEFRVDWLHTERHGSVSDSVKGELEKGFGIATLELEVPWERSTSRDVDPTTGISTRSRDEGMGNVSVGARTPFYQYVSANGLIDTTFGAAIEVGIPTNSPVSKNTEVVPKLFNDLAIGNHFTIQSVIGYSVLFGGGSDGGVQTFEYGFVFGYSIDHHDLPIPTVRAIIPMLELKGETQLNKDNAGHNSLLGMAGVRVNFHAIGAVQPRLGLGYVFPIDQGARQDLHWGIITSLVFDF